MCQDVTMCLGSGDTKINKIHKDKQDMDRSSQVPSCCLE